MSDIIEPLRFFNVQKVLPAVYGDELSYYELLAKMEQKINEEVGTINDQNAKLVLMQKAIDDFTAGGYKDDFEQFLDTWFAENLDTIEQYLQDGFGGELEDIRASITTSQEQTLNMVADEYVPFPVAPASKYGTDGQVLRTNGDGSTQWQEPVIPTDEQVETYINAWLNAHPEATTTVQDGSLTTSKYANNSITDEKLVQSGGVLERVDNLNSTITSLSVPKNLMGEELNTLYPVPPLNHGDYVSISSENAVTSWTAIVFYDSEKTQLGSVQYDATYPNGRVYRIPDTWTAAAYYISNLRDNGSRIQVELGNTVTAFEPHFASAKEIQEYASPEVIDEIFDDINRNGNSLAGIRNDLTLSVPKNLMGEELNTLYPVPPINHGDYVSISSENAVTSWTSIVFYDSEKTQLGSVQYDATYPNGRVYRIPDTWTAAAYYISNLRDNGSRIQVELGNTVTAFEPHFASAKEIQETINDKIVEGFGDFTKYHNEQAILLSKNYESTHLNNRVAFCHISDTHNSSFGYANMITDVSNAKFLVHTGDSVQDKFTDSFNTTSTIINSMTKPCYLTLGNHEVYQKPNDASSFDKYYEPIKDHNGQSSLTNTYYAVDFPTEKVKCIFLDLYDDVSDYNNMTTVVNGGLSQAQINWFLGQLDNALQYNYHVCVFMHLLPDQISLPQINFYDGNNMSIGVTYGFIVDVIHAFMTGSNISFEYKGNSYNHTFSANGIFVGYFGGHTHYDSIGKLTKYPNQNAVIVTMPSMSSNTKSGDGTLRENTNQNNWVLNYVMIDTQTRHLTVFRVGQQNTVYGYKRDIASLIY